MGKITIRKQYTTENIWKLMVKTSIPGMVGMVIVSLDSFIDALFVGRYLGADALAGVSLVLPLTLITTGFNGMLVSGFGSFLSREIGANRRNIYSKVCANLVAIVFIFALLLTAFGYYFAEELVSLTGANGQLFKFGYEYYSTLILGVVFTMFGVSIGALMRAQGDLKMASVFSAIAVSANILLNYLLIVILEWGVRGAAISSIASMSFLTICNGLYWLKKNSLAFDLVMPFKDFEMIKQVFIVGQAALVMQLLNFFRQVLIFKSAATLGSDKDIAVLGAIFRIFMLSILPVFGMLQAMQPIVGINFGSGKFRRVKKAILAFRTGGFLMLVIICIPSMICSEMVLSFFLPSISFEPDHLFHFRMIMAVLPFMIFSSTGITFLQSVGLGKVTSSLLFCRQILVFLPIFLFLIYFRRYQGIYEAILVENLCFGLIVSIITIKNFRKITTQTRVEKLGSIVVGG